MFALLAFLPGIGPAAQVASAIATFIIRCKICMLLIALAVVWLAGDIHGLRKEKRVCAAANYALALAAAKRNVTIQTAAAETARAAVAQLEIEKADLNAMVAAIKPSSCLLTPEQRKALEKIK